VKYTNPQLREICKKQKIYNNHNLANGEPYISYIIGENGREAHYPYWRLLKTGISISGNWWDKGEYRLSVFSRIEKKQKFLEIKAFALKLFGIKDWAKGPFGAYYEKSFVEKRIAEIIAKHEAGNAH
jgi:hypothetical protein